MDQNMRNRLQLGLIIVNKEMQVALENIQETKIKSYKVST